MHATGSTIELTADSSGSIHVGGVERCASPWACSVCAPTVRERRAQEIDLGVGAWLSAGNAASLVTVTIPHGGRRDDGSHLALEDTLGALLDCWRRMWSGAAGGRLRDRLGIVGLIKAVEVTWGEANGWHPHLHVLVLTEGELDRSGQLLGEVYRRWSDQVRKAGYGKVSAAHGVDVRSVTTSGELSNYLTKVVDGWGAGLEMARLDLKRGEGERWTPWELLFAASEDGDARARHLFAAYDRATAGRNAITWSPGLKDRLGVEELTDAEAAANEAPDPVAHVLVDAEDWHRLLASRQVGVLLDQLQAMVVLTRLMSSGGAPVPP